MSEFAPFQPLDGLQREEALLAPYAMRSRLSRGRDHPEPDHAFRPLYQRDRERIVHAQAFRRLMGKTQVHSFSQNDHHRNRLTHSLEVAQVSRTIARRLGLNEDLTEVIALSHDLGHPPFGHAGETALNELARPFGGFEHNRHALRIVEQLESPYCDFSGLNLAWETREAMAQHSKHRGDARIESSRGAGSPLLEAQVVDAADSLAYDTHDVDDALGLGLVALEDLEGIPFWRTGLERARTRYANLRREQFRPAVVRMLIEWQAHDLIDESLRRLREWRVGSIDEVRSAAPVVAPSEPVQSLKIGLERFLRQRVYAHPRVLATAERGRRTVADLFGHYAAHFAELPERFVRRAGEAGAGRVVCDYLAGMTDRFARQEFGRLFGDAPTA